MRQRKLYGVFIGSRWAMTTNKRVAIKTVVKEGYGQVREMPYPYDTSTWDYTTFFTCSDCIYSKAI